MVLESAQGVKKHQPEGPRQCQGPSPSTGMQDSTQSTVCKASPPPFCQRSLYAPSALVVPHPFHGLQEGFQLPKSRTQASSTCKRLHKIYIYILCLILPTNYTLTLEFTVPSDPKYYSTHQQSKALSKKRLLVCKREGSLDSA